MTNGISGALPGARWIGAALALLLSTPAAASPLQLAEAAFAAGRFAEARDHAARVSDEAPDGATARYVQGYAEYKLGRREQAARLLERSFALKPIPQVAFLCGLVAFELRRWDAARRRLQPLVSSKKEPWAAPAGELLRKLTALRRAEAHAAHGRAIKTAEGHLEAGRRAAAAHALDRAERAAPGHVLNHYYRGYLAYQAGDRAAARRHLRRALAVEPGDPWSRYMLALSLEDRAPERARLLTGLNTSRADPGLRQASLLAMEAPRLAPGSGLTVLFEVGAGLDTSPGYSGIGLTGVPFDDGDPPPGISPPQLQSDAESGEALALRCKIELGFQRELTPGHFGGVGLRVFEQGYARGGEDLEQTELAGWLQYGWRGGRLDVAASYGLSLQLLGHAPVMSLHDLGLSGGIRLRPWLRLSAGALVRFRETHNEAYAHYRAAEPSGSVNLTGQWSFLSLHVGYHLLRSQADSSTSTLSTRLNKKDEVVTTSYETDHSFWGHGPRLELELSLKWRLTLSASTWVLWETFDEPDRFIVDSNVVIWQEDRRDLQVLASVELRRPLGFGLEAAISFISVDNVSTLTAVSPVNQSYSRRLLLGSLRWRWPGR